MSSHFRWNVHILLSIASLQVVCSCLLVEAEGESAWSLVFRFIYRSNDGTQPNPVAIAEAYIETSRMFAASKGAQPVLPSTRQTLNLLRVLFELGDIAHQHSFPRLGLNDTQQLNNNTSARYRFIRLRTIGCTHRRTPSPTACKSCP